MDRDWVLRELSQGIGAYLEWGDAPGLVDLALSEIDARESEWIYDSLTPEYFEVVSQEQVLGWFRVRR